MEQSKIKIRFLGERQVEPGPTIHVDSFLPFFFQLKKAGEGGIADGNGNILIGAAHALCKIGLCFIVRECNELCLMNRCRRNLTAALGKRCIRMQFLCRRKKQVFPRDGRKIVFLFFAQVKNLVNDGSCQQDEGKNPIEEGCRRCNGKNGNDEKGRFLIGFILIDEGLDDFLRFSFCHDLVP